MNGKNYFKAFSAFFVLILLASGCCQTGTETPSVTNYTVTFKPNPPAGATGAEKLKDITKTYAAGSTLQFQTDLFSLEGYRLIGWANTATSDTPSYKAGNTFEVRENKSFYAVWEIETVTGFVIKNNVIVEFKRELGYTEVTIPATVTSIQKNVLKDSGITKIDYKGTKAAWDKLVNDSGIAADLNGITVTCSDGTWNPDDPNPPAEHEHTIIFVPAKAATCEEKGNEAYYTCASCGKFFKDEAGTQEITDKTSIEIAPLNHNFGPDGACTICGQQKTTTVDGIIYTYRIDDEDNGYYEVSGVADSSKITDVAIKNEIDGVPVTRIGDSAFLINPTYGSSRLKSITIPDSVTSIGWGAFYKCTGLTSVTIPDSVTTIGGAAFYNCDKLASVTIGNGITSIDSSVFYWCKSLTNITIPEGVTSIGQRAFDGCYELACVTIPDSVTTIDYAAFFGCHKLTNVYYEGTKEQWQEITIEKYNDPLITATICYSYTETDDPGYTLSDDQTSLVIHTDEGIARFRNDSNYDSSKLTSVIINDGVTTIGDNAFKDCSSLVDVYYGNTEERWKGITIGSGNDCLSNATMHYNDPSYTLDDSGAYLEIHDNNGFIGYKSDSNYKGKDFIQWVKINEGVTTISGFAFVQCDNLIDVTISDSVTSIANNAFYCSRLTNITIPDSVTSIGSYAFANSGLTSVTIPDSVTSIANNAFYCSDLKNVTIGSGATSIGSEAFARCYFLKEITISEGVTVIGQKMFSECSNMIFNITIPDSVTSIGDSAFAKCEDLRNVTFGAGSSLTSIGDYAFSECSRLADVTLPDSVTSIGEYAFQYCIRFTNITIPNGVTSIGKYTYYNCYAVASITIPDNVTSIGMAAFKKCERLRCVTFGDGCGLTSIGYEAFAETAVDRNIKTGNSFTIPNSVTTIDEYAFKDDRALTSVTIPDSVTTIGGEAFYNCSSLESVTIPNSVTSIGVGAFRYCSSLTSVTIPNSVTSIGRTAFLQCSKLTNVTIGNGVTSIDLGTFQNCGSLESVTIGNGVTSIDWDAFRGCSSLTDVTIPNSVTTIGIQVFYSCSSLTNIIFNGTKAQWTAINKGTNWNTSTGNYTVKCSDGEISK